MTSKSSLRSLLPERLFDSLTSIIFELNTYPNLSFDHFSSQAHWNSQLTFSSHGYSYQFNPTLSKDETITNILVKALTVFPSPDFSLCLSLLPPHTLLPSSSKASNPAAGDAPLPEAVQKLNILNNILSSADYGTFWTTLDSDDLYADLVADVVAFEELMRVQIAVEISKGFREVQKSVLEDWLNLKGGELDDFLKKICSWETNGDMVVVPSNRDNRAEGTVVRENVKFEQFSRLIRRAYEQPA